MNPGLRRAFWGVMISFFVHGLVVSTWVSRLPSVKAALHLGDGALGMALLGTAIGSITAIPICGYLVSRYGSRDTAQWTSMGFCVALVLPAMARDGITLFVALFVYGAMAGANDVAMNAQAVGTERLLGTPSISRFHAMFSLGGIAGSCIGALVAAQGIFAPVHLAASATLFLILATSMRPLMADTRQAAQAKTRVSFRRIPTTLLVLCAIGFCIFLSEGALADWTAIYLRQVLGASEGLAPMGYAVFSTAMAFFRFFGDALTKRIGRPSMIRFGGLTAAAGLALAVSVRSPYVAMAGFAAAGAGFSSIIPLVFAAGGRISNVNEGAGVATVSGLGYLGFLVGPTAIGLLSEAISLRAGLAVLVVLSTTAALLVGVVEKAGGAQANPLADSVEAPEMMVA